MGWSWWSTYFEILLVGEFIDLTTGLPGGGLCFLCIFESRLNLGVLDSRGIKRFLMFSFKSHVLFNVFRVCLTFPSCNCVTSCGSCVE